MAGQLLTMGHVGTIWQRLHCFPLVHALEVGAIWGGMGLHQGLANQPSGVVAPLAHMGGGIVAIHQVGGAHQEPLQHQCRCCGTAPTLPIEIR